jgi:hypothetical protein
MTLASWSRRGTAVMLLMALGACGSGAASPRPAATTAGPAGAPVALTDVKSVAGRWVGLIDLPGHRDDEYLEVTVQEDGTYQARTARTIGIMDAHGTVAVRDGRLLLQGARGAQGTATLVSRDGQPTLLVDMTGSNQARTTARLRRGP